MQQQHCRSETQVCSKDTAIALVARGRWLTVDNVNNERGTVYCT